MVFIDEYITTNVRTSASMCKSWRRRVHAYGNGTIYVGSGGVTCGTSQSFSGRNFYSRS
jgi:hypothetical protein